MKMTYATRRDIYFCDEVNILPNLNKTAQIHLNKQKQEDGFMTNVTQKEDNSCWD